MGDSKSDRVTGEAGQDPRPPVEDRARAVPDPETLQFDGSAIHPAELAVGAAIRLFEFAPVPYLVLSESGEIRAASHLAGQIFGADPNTLTLTDLSGRLASASRPTLRAHLRNVIATKRHGRCDLRVATADGRLIWVRLASRPLPPSREWGEGVLAVACEIDDLIRAHDVADVKVEERPATDTAWDPAYGAVPTADAPMRSAPVKPARMAAARAGSKGRRVLIVDDEKLILSSTARMLRRMGYDAEGAASGHEALALIERDPSRFELVVTDYRMPGLSGIEFAERLHALRPALPIVLVSGYTDEIDLETAVSVGIREMLSKPLTASEFEACLDRICEDELSGNAASA